MRGRLRSDQYNEDWERVIAAFQRRFVERFIKPADVVLEQDKDEVIPEGRGFAVLALDCLLLESLYGYQHGRHTRSSGATSEAFEKILLEEPFRKWFEPQDRASRFGRAVRNGILHDGETRDGWIVWKAWGDDPPMLKGEPDGRIRIYRDVFHTSVVRYVETYFAKLRDQSADGAELRENFKCRVNELCHESEPTPRAAEAKAER